MSEKDFLSQFSGNDKKPESFKEEVRVPIKKEKKPIKPIWIIIPSIVAVILLIASYFLFFAPKIEMPDFVGQRKEDVAAWVKQQGIQSQGIIFKEEYSFDYDEGEIISQSVEAYKKVKEDVKITFVESIGADPDELIEVPDLAYMLKDEIKDWIDENKLQKTKVTTAYSDTVPVDEVITFEFKGVTSDEFTRGSTLNIQVSKGPQPASVLTVEDFTGKDVSYVENWAKTKKIELNISKRFSDDVAENLVISQSIEANKTMKEKETLSIVVSSGKGILVPDFTTMTNQDVDKWISEHTSAVSVKKVYSDQSGYVISQDKTTGTTFGGDEKLNLTLNLGKTFYLADVEGGIVKVGSLFSEVEDWCNDHRYLGIDAFVGSWGSEEGVYSYEHGKNRIVSITCASHSTGEVYPCDGKLPLDVRFNVVVSKGRIYTVDLTGARNDDTGGFNTAKLVDTLYAAGIPFNNSSTGETCKLYVDDVEQIMTCTGTGTDVDPVKCSLSNLEITEGVNKVELR